MGNTAKEKSASKRKRMTDEQRFTLSRLAADMRLSQGLPIKKVKELLSLKSDSDVTRLVEYARENEVFTLIYQEGRRGKRVASLEGKLVERFGLRAAVVIDIPTREEWMTNKEGNLLYDDKLHAELGRAAADFLRSYLKMNLADTLSLGCAGGRGVYFCARSFAQKPLTIDTKVSVCALSGRMGTGVWDNSEENRNRFLLIDADDVANTFAQGFSKISEVRLINQALFIDERRLDLIEQRCQPQIAFIGIGVAQGGHRFVRGERSRRHRFVRGDVYVPPLFNVLSAWIEEYPEYYITDVAYQLEVIHKHTLEPCSDPEVVAAKEAVNKLMICATQDQLRSVRNVIAIAGGRFKTEAIHYYLSLDLLNKKVRVKTDRLIDILCTDRVTAEKLLERQEKPPPEMSAEMTERVRYIY